MLEKYNTQWKEDELNEPDNNNDEDEDKEDEEENQVGEEEEKKDEDNKEVIRQSDFKAEESKQNIGKEDSGWEAKYRKLNSLFTNLLISSPISNLPEKATNQLLEAVLEMNKSENDLAEHPGITFYQRADSLKRCSQSDDQSKKQIKENK